MIKPTQMTAYADAANEIRRAADLLEIISVARLNSSDVKRLHDLLLAVKSLGHDFYKESHDAFLRARGFIE